MSVENIFVAQERLNGRGPVEQQGMELICPHCGGEVEVSLAVHVEGGAVEIGAVTILARPGVDDGGINSIKQVK